MSVVHVHRPLHAELLYHVLAHLDLGADAASLYRRDLTRRPWVLGLLDAYRRAPCRLAVHALPLCTQDLQALLDALEPGATPSLSDEAGQVLADRLAAALEAEQARVNLGMEQTASRAEARASRFLDTISRPLDRLRLALWVEASQVPCLRVLDCDSLLRQRGTHGRAMTHHGQQVVALALAAPPGQVLCQLLHEEVHAKTDPQVLAGEPVAGRDTRAGSEGFALHRRLESRAVEAGQELMGSHAPEHLEAYGLWRQRNGC